MVLAIRWTDQAIQQINDITHFWNTNNSSFTYSERLLDKIDDTLVLLSQFPELGKMSNHENIRLKFVLNYVVYYTADELELLILGIFDTRQDPTIIDAQIKF